MTIIRSNWADGEFLPKESWNSPGLVLQAVGAESDNGGIQTLLTHGQPVRTNDPELLADTAYQQRTLIVPADMVFVVTSLLLGANQDIYLTPPGGAQFRITTGSGISILDLVEIPLGAGGRLEYREASSATVQQPAVTGYWMSAHTRRTPVCVQVDNTASPALEYTVPDDSLFVYTGAGNNKSFVPATVNQILQVNGMIGPIIHGLGPDETSPSSMFQMHQARMRIPFPGGTVLSAWVPAVIWGWLLI